LQQHLRQLVVGLLEEAAAVVEAVEHQNKQLSTSRLSIQVMQQRPMQSLSVLKSTHAPCSHNLWEQDVQVQMVE
jgi:hypothetical protein